MKFMTVVAVLAAASSFTLQPAAAVSSSADCETSWDAYDINNDGQLTGEEARSFVENMQQHGKTVQTTKRGIVSAVEYNKACIAEFWDMQAENGN